MIVLAVLIIVLIAGFIKLAINKRNGKSVNDIDGLYFVCFLLCIWSSLFISVLFFHQFSANAYGFPIKFESNQFIKKFSEFDEIEFSSKFPSLENNPSSIPVIIAKNGSEHVIIEDKDVKFLPSNVDKITYINIEYLPFNNKYLYFLPCYETALLIPEKEYKDVFELFVKANGEKAASKYFIEEFYNSDALNHLSLESEA